MKILDHGYVKFVDSFGSDESIIEAARMSTDKGFNAWGPIHADDCPAGMPVEGRSNLCECTPKPGDEKLLRYLYEHKHMTPFEMAGMTLEVQAPIFVFREWHRHRTQSYNELSARYTQLPDLYYVPSIERLMAAFQSASNKQSSEMGFAEPFAKDTQKAIAKHYESTRVLYELFLQANVAREVARVIVPVGQYSRMRASANLRNWLAFLTLRVDPAAQWEIRQYAEAVSSIISLRFPRTWDLWNEGRS